MMDSAKSRASVMARSVFLKASILTSTNTAPSSLSSSVK
jgi:hypothetical protein